MFTRTTWALIASSTLAINFDNNESEHTFAQVSADIQNTSEAMTSQDPFKEFYSHGSDVIPSAPRVKSLSIPKSTEWSNPISLRFKNHTDEEVQLCWHDYSGNLRCGPKI